MRKHSVGSLPKEAGKGESRTENATENGFFAGAIVGTAAALAVTAGASAVFNHLKKKRRVDANAENDAGGIRFEDIGTFPRRAGVGARRTPQSVRFANDAGTRLLYLQSESPETLTMSLLSRDLETHAVRPLWGGDASARKDESDFSIEEKLRRERMRMLHTGVTSFTHRAGRNGVLMIPMGNQIYVQRTGIDATPEALFNAPHLASSKTEGEKKDDGTTSWTFGSKNAPTLENPTLSGDGRLITFVCDNEVYVAEAKPDSAAKQLTAGARGSKHLTHGVASFIAQEEMDRAEGFWTSSVLQNGRRLVAFEEVDNALVPSFRISHTGSKDDSGYPPVEEHRYPFAGAANPVARIGIVVVGEARGTPRQKTPRWIDEVRTFAFDGSTEEEAYLARVQWLSPQHAPHGALLLQLQDRRQQRLALLRLDLPPEHHQPHRITVLHREIAALPKAWINLHYMLLPLLPSSEVRVGGAAKTTPSSPSTRSKFAFPSPNLDFVWASQGGVYDPPLRDSKGQMHLYLVRHVQADDGSSTKIVLPITEGADYQIDAIVGFRDNATDGRTLYVLSNASNVLESHLYAINMDDAPVNLTTLRPLTADRPGVHDSVVFNASHTRFVDTWSSRTQAPTVCLCDAKTGKVLQTIHNGGFEAKSLVARMRLRPPEFREIDSDDGKVKLHMAVYRPDAAVHGPGPYPCVVSVYGGPHVQYVQEKYRMTNNLRAQKFRQAGFVVAVLDNRGSCRRGLDFERPIREDMGNLEVQDQVTGVRHLVRIGLVDPKRVGMYGWSYGGYMSAMSLCRAPDTFAAAVAGAPVTYWKGYDTHYTERYMGLPEENEKGYRESAVMHHVSKMRGKLMLIHGLIDENVHFRHTARLVDALNTQQKQYELVLFPNERHQPRSVRDRVYMERRIFDFFAKALSGK